MTPAERRMTETRCVVSSRGVEVHLPGGVRWAVDEEAARRLVRDFACGSAIRWEAEEPVAMTEGEARALWGDR